MPTTANYSWPTPADTDLVKDGAEAIRDLGNAVDTTVKANADLTGLVHINTISIGTGLSAINFNGVFSSSYRNYLILAELYSNTLAHASLRLRSGTTDETGSNYLFIRIGATPSINTNESGATTSFSEISWANDIGGGNYINLFSPFLTQRTRYTAHINGSGARQYITSGYHNLTNSYDGFTLTVLGGATTTAGGSVSVYGYRV